MEKKNLFLGLAAVLALAGCGPTDSSDSSETDGESTPDSSLTSSEESSSSESSSETTDSTESSSEESSSEESSSSESSSSESNSEESSEETWGDEAVLAQLENPEEVLSLLQGAVEAKTSGAKVSKTGTDSWGDPLDETEVSLIANNEILTKDGEGNVTSYRGVLGEVYYNINAGYSFTATRELIDDELGADYEPGYVTGENAQDYVDSLKESAGLAGALTDYDGVGTPWFGDSRKATSISYEASINAEAELYEVAVSAYMNPQYTWDSPYTYEGVLSFDAELTLVKVVGTISLYANADWDAAAGAPVADAEPEGATTVTVDEIDYTAPIDTTEATSIIGDINAYYIEEVNPAILSGQSGIKDGKPIFQIGDKPSINWEESTYLPSTAGNSSNITLTGASDPEALTKEYNWSSTADTLNKAGTFTLYFGDVVEPRLVEVEVEVQERAPVVPYFTTKWPFAYETGNGVMTESDYENEITNVSLPLPSGPDTIGVSVSYYCEPPFDVSGIAISYSEEGIATASLAEGEDGLVLTVTPLEVGQTTITLTSSYVLGPDDYGQTEAKLAVTVTPDAPVVLEGWDKLKADWEETTIYSYGMGLACPSEPTFPYEAAELYEEAGMINVSNYLYIKATQDCVDLFIEQLLTEGAIIDGTRVEYASSTNSDGNTVLTADVYSVVIEWDSSNEMILATFTY